MHGMRWMMGALGALGLAAGYVVGCSNEADDCDRTLTCSKYLTTTGHDGGPDGDGGNPSCDGDPTTDPELVRDECGAFVSASAAPDGNGTKAMPFATFADAAAAGAKRVFACAGAYTETVQVTFSGGVDVYGGFTDCAASWTWDASSQAEIATVADTPGVVLDGGANHLENVRVTAPAAVMPGASSIAMLVNGGSLAMVNGVLTARDAKDGDAGATLGDDSTLDGDTGATGADTCSPGGTHSGAMGKTKMCPDGTSSTGGSGGDGGDAASNPAGNGTDGSAAPMASGMPDGKGGNGEGQNASAVCGTGNAGAAGAVGSSGDGGTSPGVISSTGYAGAPGADGGIGKPGQGGGGGGGAKGIASGTCMGTPVNNLAGASGGAGGIGGCGGAVGGGGKPGGSSIALVVLNADVTLTGVALVAGKSGAGGPGGSGQNGGKGGPGGANGAGGPAADACPGGKGGKGGSGGPGGGGQGGHSLGIAFKGTKAPGGGTFQIDMTANGKGGAGGVNNTTADMGKGADGLAQECWDFGTNKACGQ